MTDELLPALVRLALEAPPARDPMGPHTTPTLSLPPYAAPASARDQQQQQQQQQQASQQQQQQQLSPAPTDDGGATAAALEEPACWGAALLVNKVGDEAAVAMAVAALLGGFKLLRAPGEEQASGGLERAKRDVTSLAWLTKALAMRGSPRKAMEEAAALLIDVAGLLQDDDEEEAATGPAAAAAAVAATAVPSPDRLALALHAAEALGWILREGTPILAPRPGLTRVNPLWRQRLFHLAFARLRRALERHRSGGGHGAAAAACRAAPLLAICNLVGGLPRAVVQSEVEAIVAAVVQGMSSGHPTLAAQATETLAGLARDSVEALVPHLSTLVPLLYNLCTPR